MTTIKERFKAVKNKTLRKNLLAAYDWEFVGAYSFQCVDTDAEALYSAFDWNLSKKGGTYWLELYTELCKVETFDEAYSLFMGERKPAVVDRDARIKQLESAIRKTIRENKHLADGENCTLIHLKKALKAK
jgi:hypothetical protein